MERRFTALRLIATLMKVVGVLVFLLGVLAFCGLSAGGLTGAFGPALDQMPRMPGIALAGPLAGMAVLTSALVQGLLLYAAGEGIYLLLAIEENTRATAQGRPAVPQAAGPREGLTPPEA